MSVSDHMADELVTVSPETSLEQVSRLLDSLRMGAAVVLDDGNLAGIVTERDIVHAVAMGADLATSPAADFMSRMVTTVVPTEEMAVAAEIMSGQRIRHLPVVEDGTVRGMLSLRDVVSWSLRELGYDETHHLSLLVDLSA